MNNMDLFRSQMNCAFSNLREKVKIKKTRKPVLWDATWFLPVDFGDQRTLPFEARYRNIESPASLQPPGKLDRLRFRAAHLETAYQLQHVRFHTVDYPLS